jgi:hypothetical protein
MAQQALARGDPDGRWLRLLEAFLPVGLADMNQLQATTGFSRDQVNRLLEKFRQAAGGGQPILTRVEEKVARPWLGTRGAILYELAETGAALLRSAGHQGARACGLKEAVAIAHAAAVLDVQLAAQAAGLTVATEAELRNDANDVLRPDNLIGLPDGCSALFELEQTARPELLRRIVEGVRRRAAFFADEAERPASPIIRVLFALPRNAAWERTLRIWEKAVAAVADEHGGALPCRLLAIPLGEFMAQPDWSEPPAANRWRDLLNPGLLAGFAPAPVGQTGTDDKAAPIVTLPKPALVELARYSPHESRLVLQALWDFFSESAERPAGDGEVAPDPEFFCVVSLIYVASHDPGAPLWARAGQPYASWFLLREYLKMHPLLFKAVSAELNREGMTVWNATTIRNKLQIVANLFLRYHGFRVSDDAPVLVCAESADFTTRTTQTFYFHVSIREPELLMRSEDEVVPTSSEVVLAERALAWVLRTLALDGDRVGLRRPAFG